MSNNATLDPTKHRIRIAGYLLTGFAPDIGYSSSMDTPEFATIVGNRGLGAYSRTVSGAATITLNMMATSADNSILASMQLAGVLVPLTKTTENAELLVEGGLCHFEKNPDTSDSNTAVVTWVLKSANFKKFVAGYDEAPVANTLEEIQALIAQAPPVQAPV